MGHRFTRNVVWQSAPNLPLEPLKDEGYNWQSFLKILSLHKKDIICWSHDAITWKDFLQKLQETIADPVFKTILLRRDKKGATIDG
jgi:hypothetical protein